MKRIKRHHSSYVKVNYNNLVTLGTTTGGNEILYCKETDQKVEIRDIKYNNGEIDDSLSVVFVLKKE